MADDQQSPQKFPCKFEIKVMGKAGLKFEALVVGILREHVPDLSEGAISTVASKDGNYVSVRATINAKSKEQLDGIYFSLSQREDVLMVL